MANNVVAQVLGGKKSILDGANTVGDARRQLGIDSKYAASVDGEPAKDSDTLSDGSFVSFTEAVKGA